MLVRTSRLLPISIMAIAAVWAASCRRVLADGGVAGRASGVQRVLIITSQGEHNWRATVPQLRKILEGSGRFDVRVCEVPAGVTRESLKDFDVVVDDIGGLNPSGRPDLAIDDFVRSGKGLVMTHRALSAPPGERSISRAHLTVGVLDLKTVRPDHPIVAGLPAQHRTTDSYFVGVKAAPDAEVLATSAGEPILIVRGLGQGRMFKTALGHDLAAMLDPWFIATFARGTEWAATGKVTLPASLDLDAPERKPMRGLLITGGHDHEAAFYTLFEDFKDLAPLPVATSGAAFQQDLRGKYDVLILYDFTRELEDARKKNLRDFVEKGGGVVVLHHALLDYQDWTWWFKEAVGGSYRLKREGDVPSSSVKGESVFFVTPDRRHPITAPLEPFHLVDEAYKQVWISPKVQPLLVTDNPDSDRVVGWVGPSPDHRVVAIQLGHGPTAFGHPTYRALIHNAIRWAAGRLK